MYENKEINYFNNARCDIEKIITFPSNAKVLEIGCGNGATLIWLKKTEKCSHVTGIDAFANSADATIIDRFIRHDLNHGLPTKPDEKFDAILCLDILEHLNDPWSISKELKNLIGESGQLIVSLPNLQNYRVVFALLFKGEFNYQKEGILDQTHLRFFTKKTATGMLEDAGFNVDKVISPGKINIFKKLLSFIGLSNILAKQFIFSCSPKPNK